MKKHVARCVWSEEESFSWRRNFEVRYTGWQAYVWDSWGTAYGGKNGRLREGQMTHQWRPKLKRM
jgi:hypothetical protein